MVETLDIIGDDLFITGFTSEYGSEVYHFLLSDLEVGIYESEIALQQVQAFPNLTSGMISIPESMRGAHLVLVNSQGHPIQFDVEGDKINMSNLESGTYILSGSNQSGQQMKEIILKY